MSLGLKNPLCNLVCLYKGCMRVLKIFILKDFYSFLQDIQKSTEKQQNLKSQQTEFLSELNKLSDKAKLNGSSINAYQSDIESIQV